MFKVFINLDKHYNRSYRGYTYLVRHRLRPLTIFVNLYLYIGLLLDYIYFKLRKWYGIWTTFDGLSNRS